MGINGSIEPLKNLDQLQFSQKKRKASNEVRFIDIESIFLICDDTAIYNKRKNDSFQ